MTHEELLLRINDVHFEDTVCQADILTEADKKAYQEKGYMISLTKGEFQELSWESFYFNPQTLAVSYFPITMLLQKTATIDPENMKEKMIHSIELREQAAAESNYKDSVFTLPDAMRFEYFSKLVERKGEVVPGLYKLFMKVYTSSDYGFNHLNQNLKGIRVSQLCIGLFLCLYLRKQPWLLW